MLLVCSYQKHTHFLFLSKPYSYQNGLNEPKWTEIDQSGMKWTKVEQIDRIRPKLAKWTEVDGNKMKWTEWTELDQI